MSRKYLDREEKIIRRREIIREKIKRETYLLALALRAHI